MWQLSTYATTRLREELTRLAQTQAQAHPQADDVAVFRSDPQAPLPPGGACSVAVSAPAAGQERGDCRTLSGRWPPLAFRPAAGVRPLPAFSQEGTADALIP